MCIILYIICVLLYYIKLYSCVLYHGRFGFNDSRLLSRYNPTSFTGDRFESKIELKSYKWESTDCWPININYTTKLLTALITSRIIPNLWSLDHHDVHRHGGSKWNSRHLRRIYVGEYYPPRIGFCKISASFIRRTGEMKLTQYSCKGWLMDLLIVFPLTSQH